jgi:hypothetical protein
VGHNPLSVDPVVLRRRRQVAHHLVFFGDQDPALHLVPERMALQPAPDGGVPGDVDGLG